MSTHPALCRDCLESQLTHAPRCDHCGSPRLVSHPELFALSLAHIDCDSFYASVEKRDNPELLNKPVIVGGGKRGVVSTCCYIARINGVRSAMPMFKALEACPNAVVVKPRMEVYSKVGKQVREMMRALTPAVEPLSIDEAFLDLSGTKVCQLYLSISASFKIVKAIGGFISLCALSDKDPGRTPRTSASRDILLL